MVTSSLISPLRCFRLAEFLLDEALLTVANEVEQLTVELSEKLVENELLGQEITLADVERQHRQRPPERPAPSSAPSQQQQRPRPIQPMIRKHSPISPSPPQEQYNTSSFEDDVNTESRLSRSEDEPKITRRVSPMEGTGRFQPNTAFQHRKGSVSSVSSSSSSEDSPGGVIIKPTITVTKSASTTNGQHRPETPVSDLDMDLSSATSSSKSKGRPQRRRSSEDGELLLSTQLGEKIYSTDFEESKSKRRGMDDDDDDDDDAADTMKLSARSSSNAPHRSYSDSDEDDE